MSQKIQSPLRFPGSKSRVLDKLKPFLEIDHLEYREPFLGGGSIFLGKPLAINNWLNDIDPYVISFFQIVKEKPIDFCLYIQKQGKPTINKWFELKSSKLKDENLIERAYKFLFLNRTNYSGIFKSNPIGGLKQESEWKIDCRWNEKLICKRIIESSTKLENAVVTNRDFEELISVPGEKVLLMLDPPYYKKGHQLYPFSMKKEDHVRLANSLKNTSHNFVLTIDDCEEVREIYKFNSFKYFSTSWKYTVHSNKKDNNGKELFITNFDISNIDAQNLSLTQNV